MAVAEPALWIERPEQSIRERVANVIREAIQQGTLAPGRQLTERELEKLTGVSRTSVREALRTLQAEGLVEASPNRGLRVAVLTKDVVEQLYQVRLALEPAVVELFVQNASDEQVETLRAMTEPSEDLEELLRFGDRFYETLLDGAANPILQQMFESIDARTHTLWRVSLQAEGRATRRKAEMLAMLEAIKDRQSELAIQLTREHVRAAQEAALMVIDGKH